MIPNIYTFIYPENGIIQKKILISHENYLLFKINPEDNKKIEKYKESLMKDITLNMEWFTDKSPLFDAIFTGILNCNGYQNEIIITRDS